MCVCVCVCVFLSSRSIYRDFTYIDDVVDGIISAMDHTPIRCGEVFNIGRGVPHSLETLVSYLEEELGREANKVCFVRKKIIIIIIICPPFCRGCHDDACLGVLTSVIV